MRRKSDYEIDFDIFRTQVWMHHTLYRFEIDLKTFAKKAIGHASALKQAKEWHQGKRKITPRKVQEINQRLLGSAEVFDLPLFQLLTAGNKDEQIIHRILSPYYHRTPHGSFHRVLPPFNSVSMKIKYPWKYQKNFFNDLVYRADIHSFTLLLGMFWLGVSKRHYSLRTDSMKALWRILPAIERLEWIWPMRIILRKYMWELHEFCDSIEFIVDTAALDALVDSWQREPTSFLNSWQTLPWNSGTSDPVVVFDRRSHRKVNGRVHLYKGTCTLEEEFFSPFFDHDSMPQPMNRRAWRTFIA